MLITVPSNNSNYKGTWLKISVEKGLPDRKGGTGITKDFHAANIRW